MYKESYYNIWSGDILFNSLSRKMIKFQPKEVDTIKSFLSNVNEQQDGNEELIQSFLFLGFICDADFDELGFIKVKNRQKVFADKTVRLTINPTLQCNYRCWYCCVYEQNTQYENRRMDDLAIEKVKRLIKNYIENEKIQKLHLDWFGGEPLMYFKQVVLPISKYAYDLCQKHGVTFYNFATTNAFYMDDDMIEAFKSINMSGFQIPIDGNEQKHNEVKNMSGKGHFKKIIQSINSLCEQLPQCQITLRINYDEKTLENVEEIIPLIHVNNRQKIQVDFQRVWQVDRNVDETGNNKKLLVVKSKFEQAGYKTRYFAYSFKQYSCCYADSFYHWVINYDGNVFKCSARDYSPSLVAATIGDNGQLVFNPIVYDYFSDYTFDNEQCLKCKRLPLCYGPCVQKRYETLKQHKEFHCLHESAEISLEQYIQQLYEKKS